MEYPSLDKPKAGAFRFNTDSSQLEIYDGNQWTGALATSPNQQTGGTRGLFMGGETPGYDSTIDYINVDTTGNAIDFGDLSGNTSIPSALASRTRGVRGGGYTGSNTNKIEYVTISFPSNTTDFGDLAESKHWVQAGGNQTRGIFAGGNADSPVGHSNTIEYITIAATGNAVDFGDIARKPSTSSGSAMNSPTRSVFGGGSDPSANALNTMEYVTTSTLGNAADFGDLNVNNARYGGCSNAIRGLMGGGTTPSITASITYITIATLGNSIDFGDLTSARRDVGGCASSTRAVWGGGSTPSDTNILDYVQIPSTGKAVDFGNMTVTGDHRSGCSNGHGGLG